MSADVIASTMDRPEAPKLSGISSPHISNTALNLDTSDSELSDIEEDGARVPKAPKDTKLADIPIIIEDDQPEASAEDVEIGEITPDHYDDEGRVPVFKPTMKEFEDFERFVSILPAPTDWTRQESHC